MDADDRYDDQPGKHQHALHDIRIGDGLVAADEGVADNDHRADEHGMAVFQADKGRHRLAGRHHLRRHVGRHHDEDDPDGDQPDRRLLVVEASGEHVGYRDRVVPVRQVLQAPRDQRPGQEYPDDLAEQHPRGLQADRVAHAREPEEQPAALPGRVRAERDDPVRQLLAGEIKALERPRLRPAPHRHHEQDDEVADQDADRGVHGVGNSTPVRGSGSSVVPIGEPGGGVTTGSASTLDGSLIAASMRSSASRR